MYDETPKWKQLEKNRRRYWKTQHGVLDVFSDTYGPTDLAVVFSQNVKREHKTLLVEIKTNGYLKMDEREELAEILAVKPDNTEVRVEFLKDPNGLCGRRNTTHTKLRTYADIDRHVEKVKSLPNDG
jgi:hypothetical protein